MSGLSGLSDELEAAIGRQPSFDNEEQSSAPEATASVQLCHASSSLPVHQPTTTAETHTIANAVTSAECSHPVRYGNLCVKCGQEIPPDEVDDSTAPDQAHRELYALRAAATHRKRKQDPTPLVDSTPQVRTAVESRAAKLMKVSYMAGGITISEDDAERAARRVRAALIESKKLMLVLDLDHTLLNSKADVRLELEDRDALKEAQEQAAAVDDAQRLLFHLPHRGLWTKLRPGAYELLTELEPLYDLHVYTMGDRVYAHEMASLLDRSGLKFKNKIISRNDSVNERQKDLKLLLGAEDMVLIVDDTVAVWGECSQNIMQVERYHYFPPSPERNAPPTASLLRQRRDEDADAGQLRRIVDVLKEVHQRFYGSAAAADAPSASHDAESASQANAARDARAILADMRKETLHGCGIVFSKVIPLRQQQRDAALHPLWAMALQLGARCTGGLEADTTHVVALSTQTDKVQQALKRGLHVVHPSWLTACYFQWRRVEEALHPAPTDGDGSQYMKSLQQGDRAALAAAGGGLSHRSDVHATRKKG